MRSRRKNRNLIILGGITLAVVLLAVIMANIFMTSLSIDIKGKKTITLEVGSKYEEMGAKAYIGNLFSKKELEVQVKGDVDTSKIGTYTITYETNNNQKKKESKRIVKVVDTEKPTITLNSEVKTCKSNKTFDVDATVTDNYDGDLKDKLEYKVDDDKITLFVKDSSGNEATVEEKVTFIDDEKPVLKLNGSTTTYVKVGTNYVDEGATATDSCDGDLTKKIEASIKVDTQTLGDYQVTYQVTDSAGKTETLTRKVIVTDQDSLVNGYVSDGTIYLTFDDGPGQYTDEILDILDKYNVKATFFVTSQFPKYVGMIKEEAARGHVVGIHTYSHKWSIYDSVDAYLNDFNKMEQIVFEQTGTHPKYFRFPGGTSNTVSKKHSVGIMSKLSSLMTEKGYTYYDWDVDSCDTCTPQEVSDIVASIKKYIKGNKSYIVLMHDIKKNTMTALPTVIEYLQGKGYKFSSLNENAPLKQFKAAN